MHQLRLPLPLAVSGRYVQGGRPVPGNVTVILTMPPIADEPVDRSERVAPAPEEALRVAALRGDDRAWSALVARHNHRVVVALLAWGVRADRAQDLAQATWLRLLEQQRRGALRALELPGLAVAQARFLALDEARTRGVAARLVDEDGDGHVVADPSPGAEEHVLGGQQVRRAEEALLACNPTAQRVFLAVYDDPARPHADVAREVGLSLQRVRQIVCEVRHKLRAALEG